MLDKKLNKSDSIIAMREWLNNYPNLPALDDEYLEIRKNIHDCYEQTINNIRKSDRRYDYKKDVYFGLSLYQYFWSVPGFSLRVAANEDFWRYLSLKVVPDTVASRWDKDADDRYWKKPTRIWLRSIWWYIHLSWQGNVKNTINVLLSTNFTTDTILNLEERSGTKGTYIQVYRYIMYYASLVDYNSIYKNRINSKENLFRTVMKLHTAKSMVIEPSLYIGGERGYAKSLFNDIGVNV